MSSTTSLQIAPKIAIILFPGSNYELETKFALESVGMIGEEFLWNGDLEKFADYDGYFITGGFSFEDRIRSGVISSKSDIVQVLYTQAKVGKPILGVCNGAQILIESGLVPGIENLALGGALAHNRRMKDGKVLGTGFYNSHVNIKITNTNTAFTNCFEKDEVIEIIVAHGEGKFVFSQPVFDTVKNQITTQYCDESGSILDEFPINPNGSMSNIASIINPSGNVMAIMPHPERSATGIKFFQSMKKYIQELKVKKDSGKDFEYKELPLSLVQGINIITDFEQGLNSELLAVRLRITDNEEQTTQMLLDQKNIKVKLTKYIGWNVKASNILIEQKTPPIRGLGGTINAELINSIITSEELFNPKKEKLVELELLKTNNDKIILVKNIEDSEGKSKLQTLQALSSDFESLANIDKYWIWGLKGQDSEIQNLLDSNILANPFSQEVNKLK